jgi:hypothetical protein
MNLHAHRSVLFLPMFALLALNGAPAAAQPPLPIPAAKIRIGFQVKSPINGSELYVYDPGFGTGTYRFELSWSNPGEGFVHKIQLRIPGQPEVLKIATTPLCDDYCTQPVTDIAHLFTDLTHTSQVIEWRVAAKDGATKLKANWATATVVEVEPPTLDSPDDQTLDVPSVFAWYGGSPDQQYTLVIKDMLTGAKLTSYQMPAALDCVETSSSMDCSVLKNVPGITYPPNRNYKWFVKAVGLTGEKAVSVKRAFFSPGILI